MNSGLRTGLFHTSPFNFDPRVTLNERLRLPITITDVTLREGQQAADIAFTPEDEVALARALAGAGIPMVQTGYAGADDATTRRVRDALPRLGIAVLLVGWKDDAVESLQTAHDAGADVCSVLFRSADAHITNLGHTRESARARVMELVSRARRVGYRHVVLSPSFATLADFGFLMSLYETALDAGATVISLSDSMGTAKPSAIAFLVENMRRVAGNAGVRVHMHNDFGLAVANTLAGIESGADWVEATVNGLGERAGNCPLEELVIALEALYGVRTSVVSEKLYGVCRLVESLTKVPIPPMKPAVGADVFSNKLEIHVKAAAADPALMEPYDPAAVGGRRTIRLGRGTGPTGVQLKLVELGLHLAADRIDRAVAKVNEAAIAAKRGVTDDEFRRMIQELGGEA